MQIHSEQIAETMRPRRQLPNASRACSSSGSALVGAAFRPEQLAVGTFLALQRAAGNAAVLQLLRAAQPTTGTCTPFVQRTLEVGGNVVTTISGDALTEPLATLGELANYQRDGIESVLMDWMQDGEGREYANWSEAVTAAKEEYEKPFGTNDAALSYLAGVTGDTVESLEGLDIDLLKDMGYSSRSDIDGSLGDYAAGIAGARWKAKGMPAQGSGRSGSGKWATNRVRSAALSIVGAAEGSSAGLFPGGKYTIHHKISRNTLTDLWGKIITAGDDAAPVVDFLKSVGQEVGTSDPYKALLNIPANLEVGPPADQRLEDPGTGFDPNLDSGSQTPRSKKLAEVEQEMPKKAIDWNKLRILLDDVVLAQGQMAGDRGTLSQPRAAQWKKSRGGKFERG